MQPCIGQLCRAGFPHRGQGDVSDKTSHEETGNNVLLPVPCWNPWVLQFSQGTAGCFAGCHCPVVIFCTSRNFLMFLSAALWGVQAVEPGLAWLCCRWKLCRGVGYKENQIHSHVPLVLLLSLLFLEKCCGWNISFGLHLPPSALQGDKERLFSSPCTPLDAQMGAHPKRLL